MKCALCAINHEGNRSMQTKWQTAPVTSPPRWPKWLQLSERCKMIHLIVSWSAGYIIFVLLGFTKTAPECEQRSPVSNCPVTRPPLRRPPQYVSGSYNNVAHYFCFGSSATSVIICIATRGPCQVNINMGHFRQTKNRFCHLFSGEDTRGKKKKRRKENVNSQVVWNHACVFIIR